MTVAVFQPSLTQRIRRLFAAGEQGAWFDPSDFTSMFQDSAGTTPVTAVSQPVGLVLDKRKGLVLGPELVTNGTFDDSTGWDLAAGWTVGGGVLNINTSVWGSVGNTLTGVATGKRYKVELDATVASGSFQVYFPTVGGNVTITSSGHKAFYVPGDGTTGLFSIGASACVGTIDNISVKLLDGNHAAQATAAARPTLQQDANGKYYLAFDGIDDKLSIADTDGLDFGQGSFIAAFALTSNGASEYDVIYGKGNSTSADNLRCFITSADTLDLFWGSDAQFYGNGPLLSKNIPKIIEYGVNSTTSSVIYAVNGAETSNVMTLSGTGSNTASATLGGQPDASGYPANMNLYSCIIRKGTQPSAAEKTSLRRYLASKSGVVL